MGISDDEQRGDVPQMGGFATEIKPVGALATALSRLCLPNNVTLSSQRINGFLNT